MVLEVIRLKHPEACLASDAIPDSYKGVLQEIVPLDITEDTVMEVDIWIS